MKQLFMSGQEILQPSDVVSLDGVEVHGDVPLLAGHLEGGQSERTLLTTPLGVLCQVQGVAGQDGPTAPAENGGGEGFELRGVSAANTLTAEVLPAHQADPSDGGGVEGPDIIIIMRTLSSERDWSLTWHKCDRLGLLA